MMLYRLTVVAALTGILLLVYLAYGRLEVPLFPLLAIAFALTVLIALSVLYFRSSSPRANLERLRIVAKAHYLGNTAALRPFQKRLMNDATDWKEYENDIFHRPEIVQEHVVWPCVLCISVVFAMAAMLFVAFDKDLYVWPSMILGGALAVGAEAAGCPEMQGSAVSCPEDVQERISRFQLGSLQVVMYSFLTAYIWAIWQLFQRMVTRDVTVYAFHVITVRVVTTAILSLILYQAISEPPPPGPAARETLIEEEAARIDEEAASPAPEPPAGIALAEQAADVLDDSLEARSFKFDSMILLAVAIGFFPETVLRWLANLARRFVFRTGRLSSYFDLEKLEGVDTITRARLAETGIIDATHLAASNPVTLALRTPFTIQQIVDWIGQAQLLVLVKTVEFNRLRDSGIRTSYQFYRQAGPASATARAALDHDPSFLRLKEVMDRMLLGPPSKGAPGPDRP